MEDVSRITTRTSREVSKRTLHLIDTTGKMVAATLWGEEVTIALYLYYIFLISLKLLMDLQVKYIRRATRRSLLISSLLNFGFSTFGRYLLSDLQPLVPNLKQKAGLLSLSM